MFLTSGIHCYYVTEYMERGAVSCLVGSRIEGKSKDSVVFEIECEREDAVLGDRFFAEITYIPGLQTPDKVIPVRVYLKRNAWQKESPLYKTDVVEMGFACTKAGLIEAFPSMQPA